MSGIQDFRREERIYDLPPKRNRKLVQAFVMERQMQGCEFFGHIEGECWDKILKAYFPHGNPASDCLMVEPHHIYQGTTHRWDIDTNLVAISRPAHDWAHRNKYRAITLGIWVRMNDHTFDRDLICDCMGFDPIDRLETYIFTDEWIENIRMDIKQRL